MSQCFVFGSELHICNSNYGEIGLAYYITRGYFKIQNCRDKTLFKKIVCYYVQPRQTWCGKITFQSDFLGRPNWLARHVWVLTYIIFIETQANPTHLQPGFCVTLIKSSIIHHRLATVKIIFSSHNFKFHSAQKE